MSLTIVLLVVHDLAQVLLGHGLRVDTAVRDVTVHAEVAAALQADSLEEGGAAVGRGSPGRSWRSTDSSLPRAGSTEDKDHLSWLGATVKICARRVRREGRNGSACAFGAEGQEMVTHCEEGSWAEE